MSASRAWQHVEGRNGTRVDLLRRRFRRECVLPFFTDDELAKHARERGNSLTPTLGFEALVHGLYACESVGAFGFYVEPEQLRASTPAADASLRYHYWEPNAHDGAAKVPGKPWTYPSHNYEVESARLQHMATQGCLLMLYLPVPLPPHPSS